MLIFYLPQNTEERLTQCSSFGNLFFLLSSIIDSSSFKEAKRLGRFIKDSKTSGEYSIVVVGTKRDLREYRAVSEEEGHMIANELGGTYHEISSADGYEDIERLFRDSVKSHLQSRFTFLDGKTRAMGLKKTQGGPFGSNQVTVQETGHDILRRDSTLGKLFCKYCRRFFLLCTECND